MNTNKMNDSIITISKEQLAKLPAASFVGDIHLVENEDEMEAALYTLRRSDILGFDTETRPSFKKGYLHTVSLLQLSTRTDCYLFRLNKIGMNQALVDLLEDEEITKVGLSIHDDFHSLRKLTELNPQGFIDLQQYVKEYRIIDNSLTRIYGILFGQRISKGQRLTNWEAETLSPAQQGYAALDALACVTIYDHLRNGNFDPLQSEYLTSMPELTAPAPKKDDADSTEPSDAATEAEAQEKRAKAAARRKSARPARRNRRPSKKDSGEKVKGTLNETTPSDSGETKQTEQS